MCRKVFYAAVLLLSATGVCAAGTYVVPTTTLTAQKGNNTSAANTFFAQTNGNAGPGNVSKVNVHSLLYSGATAKVYAHLMLWFGASNHMNVGYSSTDPAQIHRQVTDMISRGINGVIIDWYGPNTTVDQATKLVMAEAEGHPGFTFAIMIDQGAISKSPCSGCTPQQTLVYQLQYIQQTYFPSPAYMTQQGRPVVTNFDIDLHYTIDWVAASAALSTQPLFLFQNNSGFTHVLSNGSYSWVMPTTTDYGMSYLTNFYDTGIPLLSDQTVGASYKGFNDSLAAWGKGRIMDQRCGQTWLQTFSEIKSLYNSGRQLSDLQLVTWNDYEEGTEIESGISNCLSIAATTSGNSLQWTIQGDGSTVDHYTAYISTDGQNLMFLRALNAGTRSVNLCNYSVPNGNYILYVKAVGKPSITNQMSGPVTFTSTCGATVAGTPSISLGTDPSSMTIPSGGSGNVIVTATALSGPFNNAIALTCSGLPKILNCSFSPASLTPGSGDVSSTLTIASNSIVAENHRQRNNALLAIWGFSFGLFGLTLIGKVQRSRIPVLGASVLVAVIVSCASCGGNSSGRTSSPNIYTVTVNGNSSAVQLATTVTITVK